MAQGRRLAARMVSFRRGGVLPPGARRNSGSGRGAPSPTTIGVRDEPAPTNCRRGGVLP